MSARDAAVRIHHLFVSPLLFPRAVQLSRTRDSTLQYGAALPAKHFKARPGPASSPLLRTLLFALSRNDSFATWTAYLALREHCVATIASRGVLGAKKAQVLDRALFAQVLFSLDYDKLVGHQPVQDDAAFDHDKSEDTVLAEHDRVHDLDAVRWYTGVRPLLPTTLDTSSITPRSRADIANALWHFSLTHLSLSSRTCIRALPSEILSTHPSSSVTCNNPTLRPRGNNPANAEFFTRITVVRSDIEALFGPLRRSELAHWLDAARAADSRRAARMIWTLVHAGADPDPDAPARRVREREYELVRAVGLEKTEKIVAQAAEKHKRSRPALPSLEAIAVAAETAMNAAANAPGEEGELINADTRMWNSYIAAMARTATPRLRRVRNVGRVSTDVAGAADEVNSDSLVDLEDEEDVQSWLLNYLDTVENTDAIVDELLTTAALDPVSPDPPASSLPATTTIDAAESSIFDAADVTTITRSILLELRKYSAVALKLVEDMVYSGVLPNATTYEILMLALAKSGNLIAVEAIVRVVWGVVPPFTNDNDTATRTSEDRIQLGSRLYPSFMTLFAIRNCYAINNRADDGALFAGEMLGKYLFSPAAIARYFHRYPPLLAAVDNDG
ncbi:uncharacterized protein V1518DRAFT_415679 [Limtongia smithiae]|uniref:uncharacterized protein n=1 Tax=Limtongia smithiae TaxID=1125753 RepID=UPI0034CD1253